MVRNKVVTHISHQLLLSREAISKIKQWQIYAADIRMACSIPMRESTEIQKVWKLHEATSTFMKTYQIQLR
jgi:hypothetical protein